MIPIIGLIVVGLIIFLVSYFATSPSDVVEKEVKKVEKEVKQKVGGKPKPKRRPKKSKKKKKFKKYRKFKRRGKRRSKMTVAYEGFGMCGEGVENPENQPITVWKGGEWVILSMELEGDDIVRLAEKSVNQPTLAIYFTVPKDGKIQNLPDYLKQYVDQHQEMKLLYNLMMSNSDGIYDMVLFETREDALDDLEITKLSYERSMVEQGEPSAVAKTHVNDRYPEPTF